MIGASKTAQDTGVVVHLLILGFLGSLLHALFLIAIFVDVDVVGLTFRLSFAFGFVATILFGLLFRGFLTIPFAKTFVLTIIIALLFSNQLFICIKSIVGVRTSGQ